MILFRRKTRPRDFPSPKEVVQFVGIVWSKFGPMLVALIEGGFFSAQRRFCKRTKYLILFIEKAGVCAMLGDAVYRHRLVRRCDYL